MTQHQSTALRWRINGLLGVLWVLRLRDRWRRAKAWWLAPFRLNVDIHERTRIEWRVFPPRLRLQALAMSLQDEIDAAHTAGGGTVSIRPGRIHLTTPVDLTQRENITLRDMHLVGHAECAIVAKRPVADGDPSQLNPT